MFKPVTTFDADAGAATGFSIIAPPLSMWGHGGNSYGTDVAAHYFRALNSSFICLATRDRACTTLVYAWMPKIFGLTE